MTWGGRRVLPDLRDVRRAHRRNRHTDDVQPPNILHGRALDRYRKCEGPSVLPPTVPETRLIHDNPGLSVPYRCPTQEIYLVEKPLLRHGRGRGRYLGPQSGVLVPPSSGSRDRRSSALSLVSPIPCGERDRHEGRGRSVLTPRRRDPGRGRRVGWARPPSPTLVRMDNHLRNHRVGWRKTHAHPRRECGHTSSSADGLQIPMPR